MITTVLRKFIFVFVLLLTYSLSSYCQNVEVLSSPNINAQVGTDGILFWNGKKAQFNVPRTQKTNTLSSAALWIGGLDPGKKLHLAAQTYRESGTDFWPGPLNQSGTIDSVTSASFNKIFKVSKLEIDSFILGLSTPSSILNWPGNGDTIKGYPKKLAPFVDKNGNGVYEPSNGDYPAIKGDIGFWWVYNDSKPHTESHAEVMGIQVSVLAYAYSCGGNTILSNSLFFDYQVINKSKTTYSNTFLGQWADFDIGNPHNDYVGIDRKQGSVYGYNGQNNDNDTSGVLAGDTITFNGYKGDLPVQSISFGQGLKHNQLGLPISSFMPLFNSELGGNQGKPRGASHYYNYLKGFWLNGDSMTASGTGWNTSGSYSSFAFNGNPISKTGWTELGSKNPLSDRSTVTSFGNVNFAPDDTLTITTIYSTHLSNSSKIENGLIIRSKEINELNDLLQKDGLYPCTAVSTCASSPSCVWPGDADNDGVTGARDIFRIGYAYGEKGPKRSIVSVGQVGQSASDFGKSFPDGLDFKYADANGDGVIDTNDVISITSNYGLAHNKKETNLKKKGSGVALKLEIVEDSFEAGQIVTIYIKLGDGTLQATDVYGVAFSVLFDNQVIDSSSISVDMRGWLSVGGQFIGVVKDQFKVGKSQVGISRINKTGLTDTGIIIKYKYVISDNISGGFKPKINFGIADHIAVNSQLDTLNLVVSVDSIHLRHNGVDEISRNDNLISIFPNPADEICYISAEKYPIRSIVIFDALGRRVFTQNTQNSITVRLETKGLSNGVYLVMIDDSKQGRLHRKLSINHR